MKKFGFVNTHLILAVILVSIFALIAFFVLKKDSGQTETQATATSTPSPTPSPANVQNKQQGKKTVVESPYEAFLQFVDKNFSGENYVKPVNIKIDPSCEVFESDYKSVAKRTITCDPLSQATSGSKKIVLKPIRQEKVIMGTDFDYDVYLEFWENGQKLNVPIYKFPSYLGANLRWFNLSVSFFDRNNIYVNDYGGHETSPRQHFFDGTNWKPLPLWEMVEPYYPKESIDLSNKGLPTFEIIVSDKNLKVVEVTNAYYGFEGNIRYVFIFDRASRQYIRTETYPVN